MIALAWTLLHFLWQGAAIAVAVALILRSGAWTASTRYVVGVAALALMLAAPIATYFVVSRTSPSTAAWFLVDGHVAAAVPINAAGPPIRVEEARTRSAAMGQATRYASVVVWSWAVGVLLLTVRLFGGWVVAHRLARRVVTPAAPDVRALAHDVSQRLGLTRLVEVFESSRVTVPVVIGWLTPVVLLPASALAGLPPAQVQALLAHELAHVRRHDYLVNLLQSLVETVLFYHPAVWWVSRQVRTEREHCCDDVAVSVCDRVEYASALSALAAMASPATLALAATDGSLVARVRRLLGRPDDALKLRSPWLGAAAAVLVMAMIPVVMTAMPARSSGFAASPRSFGTVDQVLGHRAPGDAASAETASSLSRVESERLSGFDDFTPRLVLSGSAVQAPSEADNRAFLERELERSQAEREKLAEEQRALERSRSEDQTSLQRADITAQLDELRARLKEAQVRYEIGLVGQSDVAKVQAEVAALERRLESLEHESKFQQQLADLAKQRAEAEGYFQQLANRAAAQRTQAPEQQASRTAVLVDPDGSGRSALYFFVASRPYVQDGPSAVVHVPEGAQAKLADGRQVSALRITGWSEGSSVRVMVVALVPRQGESSGYTIDEKRLTSVDVGTYLLGVGQTLSLDDLAPLGIRDVTVKAQMAPR